MQDRGIEAGETEIKYILTVPAIWNDRSKQFMRVPAVQAGIKDDYLELALEPEAASVYCQRVPLENLKLGTGKVISVPGTRYLVADIGGGTADFSVHEVDEDGSLTELYRASGGAYGGIYVDENYLKIYDIIYGAGTIEQLRIDDMEEYLNILKEFENKKRSISSDSETSLITRLPAIIKHIKYIAETIKNIENILIVGGYGECTLLQERFKKEFPKLNIVIPNECSVAVIKGAVLFGHNPRAISARILRYSYGAAADNLFDPEIHPEENGYFDIDGIERCRNAFDQLIARDTKVPSNGQIVTDIGFPLTYDQRSYELRLYCTEKINAPVIDDSFQYVGRLEVSVPEYIEGDWEAEEQYIFGMTEIKVSATVKETGETVKTTFDLLE
ncbi:heat shock 70 kDa protein 12A-like [Saccostrea cucullata]|uniref:heat shock 70 kDa protein 12A-like n=1 Tax=Saccostrea cuccullata TaxID=36930 RepID=UPI002ED02D1B